jgi:hypothetical protein
MSFRIFATAVCMAVIAAARADVASSANYSITVSSIDGGGLRSTSAAYAQNVVITTFSGQSAAGAITMGIGFAAELNNPPVAGNDLQSHPKDQAVNIPAVSLFGNDFDPDGDTFTIIGVDRGSAGGGRLALSSQVVTYTPPPGQTGSDTFKYLIADSNGDTATATVTMLIAPPIENQPLNSVTFTPQADGKILLRFRQQPGWAEYDVELSHDLNGPWQLLQSFHASGDGIVEVVIDPKDAPQTFFRAVVF